MKRRASDAADNVKDAASSVGEDARSAARVSQPLLRPATTLSVLYCPLPAMPAATP